RRVAHRFQIAERIGFRKAAGPWIDLKIPGPSPGSVRELRGAAGEKIDRVHHRGGDLGVARNKSEAALPDLVVVGRMVVQIELAGLASVTAGGADRTLLVIGAGAGTE